MTIWKYPLPLEHGVEQIVEIPTTDADRFLALQMQGNTPCLWVAVEPGERVQRWHFHWVGTGDVIPDAVLTLAEPYPGYVGTVQVSGGAFVFHLFQSGYESESE